MNTTYRKNLKDVAIACKNYVDNAIYALKWELGSHTLDVTTDTDIKYLKSVPSDTIGCQINKVGGMSYKRENLLQLSDVAETTINGITYSITNGVISLSGTATQRVELRPTSHYFATGDYCVKVFDIQNLGSVNVRFFADAIMANSNLTSTTLSHTFSVQTAVTSDFGFVVPNGATVNATFKYMLVSGSTAPITYKPYFSGIRDTAVSQLIIGQANLWNNNTVLEIGAIDGSGNDTELNTRIRIKQTSKIYLTAGTYSVAFGGLDEYIWYGYTNSSDVNSTYNNYGSWQNKETSFTLTNNCYVRFAFRYSDNRTITSVNELTNIKLVKGTYVTPTIKPIPSQIQALTGYGWGINDTCYNYIDFDRKVFVQKVDRVDLSALSWNYVSQFGSFNTTSLANVIKHETSGSVISNLLCSLYTVITAAQAYTNQINMGVGSNETGTVFISNSNYSDATSFNNAMNGIYLYYELATPVETDISAYLTTDTLDVEGGGSLEFTNTYSQDVPSDIDYLIEEVKA